MKRKLASIILTIATIFTLFSIIGAATPKIGDSLGDVLYSDIVAYIDGNAIPTSIKNGTTMVVVEDLARYGFDVNWNGAEKTLKVERNTAKTFNPLPVVKDTIHTPGTFKCKYVYTDIKTYISGQLVESFAIDGVTLIDFELLMKYGKLNWNGTTREIKLTLDKTVPAPIKPLEPATEAVIVPNTTVTLPTKPLPDRAQGWALAKKDIQTSDKIGVSGFEIKKGEFVPYLIKEIEGKETLFLFDGVVFVAYSKQEDFELFPV